MNLFPAQTTPFIGRRRELAEIENILTNSASACRLLTLVGPGGIGKTRLALAVAAGQKDEYADGVNFVPLQPVDSVERLITAIADGVGFSLHGYDDLRAQLLAHLRDRESLLVLDNFEQLLSAGGPELLAAILNHAPAVTLLVTSREVLNLQEEWLYPVQGLSVPDAGDDNFEAFDAVQLFVERARRIRPDFALSDERRHVHRICRLVEGMPLAIELATSWLKTLGCAAIADEIQRSIDFLSTNVRNVPDRHRNMQAVFDYSWTRLTREERTAFKRLSVFRGGFRRKAAEAVALIPSRERSAGTPLPILSALVDKCMVRRQDDRYHMHELLRQYGEEKLRASPDEAARVRELHGRYYTDFLHSRLDDVNGFRQHRAFTEIAAELENVRAAWQWAVAQANVDAIHRAATTFFFFCQQKCSYLEAANALAEAAASIEQQPSSPKRDRTLALLLNHEGWLRIRVGEFDRAETLLERSQTIYGRLDKPPPPYMGTDSATPLALVAVIRGNHDRAVALCESVRESSEARGDQHNLSFAHYGLTAARLAKGQYDAAYEHAQRACALARALGNRWFLAYPLNEWGKVARALGNHAEAKRHFQASYTIKEEFNDLEGMAVALNHLGEIALLQEEYEEARQSFRQSLDIYRDINDRGGLTRALKGLGSVACAVEDTSTARDRFREALQIATDIQFLPLVFAILVDVAPLLRQKGTPTLSVQLLTLVQQHPAGDHETRTQAQQRLEHYEADMAADVFADAVRQGEEWDLETAVAALKAELAAQPAKTERQPEPDQPLIEPLTSRELDVLHLMAEGYTNPEIADELVIAVGTVKWYASQIYGKLGVENRTEATVRARELELLH